MWIDFFIVFIVISSFFFFFSRSFSFSVSCSLSIFMSLVMLPWSLACPLRRPAIVVTVIIFSILIIIIHDMHPTYILTLLTRTLIQTIDIESWG